MLAVEFQTSLPAGLSRGSSDPALSGSCVMCGLYLCPRTPYLCTAAALNNLLCPEHTQFSLTFRFCTSCFSRKESPLHPPQGLLVSPVFEEAAQLLASQGSCSPKFPTGPPSLLRSFAKPCWSAHHLLLCISCLSQVGRALK